ncbi:DUF418 domain-containing protein [Staphylococcus taiwanensis]|nr:DUF418 domain-containing protein [Staphylococcus taiwanensis]
MSEKRIVGLDIIRGIAIAVVLFANVSDILPIVQGEVKPTFTHADHIVKQFFAIFIDTRFITLFTLLFGIGMGIFMNNARKKSLSPIKLMFRRLIFLLIVGIPGVILVLPYAQYALSGLILMFLFLLPKPRYTLWISFVLIVGTTVEILIAPSSNPMFYTLLGVMTFGLYLSQSGLIYQFHEKRTWFIVTLCISSLIVALLVILKVTGLPYNWTTIEDLVTPYQAIIYFIVLIFMTQKVTIQQMLKPFEKLGKTAFTNFMTQMILLYIVVKCFFPYDHPTPTQSLYIGLPILVVNILATYWWLSCHRQGPLEILWRKWTYKNVPKNK